MKSETLKRQQEFVLVGVVDPGLDDPGFVVPAFRGSDKRFYLANTSSDRVTVSSFSPTDLQSSQIVKVPNSEGARLRVGQENVFAFRDARGSVDVDTKIELVKRLRKKFQGLARHPFAQLEIAGFINEPSLIANAVRRSVVIEASAHGGDTRKAFIALAHEYGLDEEYASRLFALDYAKALLSYYRLFNRLIHVSDQDRRNQLIYRFQVATDNIVPFLLDDGLLDVISKRSMGEQLAFPHPDMQPTPPEFGVEKALTRLGVSRTIAKKYAFRLKVDDVGSDLQPSTAIASQAYHAIRTLEFRNRYKKYALGRLEKKRRKHALDTEFMDLVFGLSAVLSHELRSVTFAANDYYLVCRNLLYSMESVASSEDAEGPSPA